ncbi:MAG TPA: aminotransferase class I/II-fold pyridoxal phosphate-dependent enzyme [Fimbriimonadaceae bacterium]|nr:aminotransferase class I/II-fold pyridoxal phosphate-dependent enzyme [Fimbriimonadaceae bacterium]
MSRYDRLGLESQIQHLGEEEHVLGAVTPPIFQTSLFVHEDCSAFEKSFDATGAERKPHNYSRISNPTLDMLERKLARMEHCEAGKVFGSGMAAISAAIMHCVESGSHVVAIDTCYGPTRMFLEEYLPKFGVTTTFVAGLCPEDVLDAIRPETKAIYLESPGSILFRLQDLETICSTARAKGIATIHDNSYSSPIFQNPADFGVDIIVHSASKYLGGHSDIVAGAMMTSQERMDAIIQHELALLGGILAPFPAWLMLRGVRTLPIRMKAHQEVGNFVANWLLDQPEVAQVFHPGLPTFPQRELFTKQMRGSGGLLSFEPVDQDEAKIRAFADALELYQLGVSWGGFESLCVPLTMHPIGWNERRWVVRLFNGLETPTDLLADLRQAFDRAGLAKR